MQKYKQEMQKENERLMEDNKKLNKINIIQLNEVKAMAMTKHVVIEQLQICEDLEDFKNLKRKFESA